MSDAARPIVVGHDDDPTATDALALGAALARATGDPLLLARVCPDDDDAVSAADESLGRVADELGGSAQTRVLRASSPAAGLYELAEEVHPEAVVVGSHRRGPAGRLFAGRVAERLLQGAPCPVVVAPRGFADAPADGLRTVCVAFDGRPESWAALQHGARLAAASGAKLRIVCATRLATPWPTATPLLPEVIEGQRTEAERLVAQAVASVSRRLDAEGQAVEVDPVQALEAEAEHGADLLVLGSRGYGPLHRVLVGSVSTPLMRVAACPVMVVPRSVEFDPSATGLAGSDELGE